MPNRIQNPQKRRTSRLKPKRRRRLPPGQRLILYGLLATLITFTQATKIPADTPEPLAPGAQVETPLATIHPFTEPFTPTEDFQPLEDELQTASDKPRLRTGVFVIEPRTGRYVDFHGHEAFSAASMIKLPILVDLAMAIDKGTVKPSQEMVMRKDLMAGGSGWLQWRKPNSKLSLAEVAHLMITISDNTATNMIIDLLGGIKKVDKDLASIGLSQTRINDWLPDLAGTNKTSPYELAWLLGRIEKGELVSKESRNWMYQLLAKTKTRSLLPVGLEHGAVIYHKTGDIGSMVGDAGVIQSPEGTRYICVVQVERPHNDLRANLLIRYLSRYIYQAYVNDNTSNVSFADMAPKARPMAYLTHLRHHHGRQTTIAHIPTRHSLHSSMRTHIAHLHHKQTHVAHASHSHYRNVSYTHSGHAYHHPGA